MKRVTAPKLNPYHAETYSAEELQQLFELVKGHPILEIPIVLAAACGLRRGEALALTEGNINFNAKTISIEKQYVDLPRKVIISAPKSDKSYRTFAVHEEILDIIRRHMEINKRNREKWGENYKENHLLVCLEDGTPIRPTSFSKSFSKFIKKHGLKKIRYHDLRHSFITLMANINVPLLTTSRVVGHSNPNTTARIYTHAIPEGMRDAMQRAGTVLFSGRKEGIDSEAKSS